MAFQENLTGKGLKPMLTNDDAAKMLGVSKRTLQRMRSENRIDFIKIGNQCRYQVEAIERMVEERTITKGMKKSIRDFFRELLELLFQAAALVIDVLRTFFLIVLSILGPLCFAISVWDGFQSTLTQWFCRYIQIYLWLPISDLFSTILAKIQVLMLQNDIEALQNDPNFSIEASNGVYIVFLIIGIIGYFTIPTVAGWIIQAGGGIGNYNRNVNTAGSLGGSIAGATAGNVAGRAGRLIKSGFKKI